MTTSPKHNKQRGAALVIVIFVVALVATIAAEMTSQLMIAAQKGINIHDNQQAKWYGMAAEGLAKKLLIEAKQEDTINRSQAWAIEAPAFPVENGTIEAKIVDLQACFNLNSLRVQTQQGGSGSVSSNTRAKDILKNIIQSLEGDDGFPITDAPDDLVNRVVDWVDADSNREIDGAEDGEYLSQPIPYLAANNYMSSVTELRLIPGFNPIMLSKLMEYVCVIPDSGMQKINVNSLTEEDAILLAGMVEQLDESGAQSIISDRPDKGWKDVADFENTLKKHAGNRTPNQENRETGTSQSQEKPFAVTSEYFQLQAKSTFLESHFSLTTTFFIAEKGRQIQVLGRKFGGVQ